MLETWWMSPIHIGFVLDDGKTISVMALMEVFKTLASMQFIKRCSNIKPVDTDPSKLMSQPTERDSFLAPAIDPVSLQLALQAKADTLECQPDDGIYWHVNMERFDLEFRYVQHMVVVP